MWVKSNLNIPYLRLGMSSTILFECCLCCSENPNHLSDPMAHMMPRVLIYFPCNSSQYFSLQIQNSVSNFDYTFILATVHCRRCCPSPLLLPSPSQSPSFISVVVAVSAVHIFISGRHGFVIFIPK